MYRAPRTQAEAARINWTDICPLLLAVPLEELTVESDAEAGKFIKRVLDGKTSAVSDATIAVLKNRATLELRASMFKFTWGETKAALCQMPRASVESLAKEYKSFDPMSVDLWMNEMLQHCPAYGVKAAATIARGTHEAYFQNLNIEWAEVEPFLAKIEDPQKAVQVLSGSSQSIAAYLLRHPKDKPKRLLILLTRYFYANKLGELNVSPTELAPYLETLKNDAIVEASGDIGGTLAKAAAHSNKLLIALAKPKLAELLKAKGKIWGDIAPTLTANPTMDALEKPEEYLESLSGTALHESGVGFLPTMTGFETSMLEKPAKVAMGALEKQKWKKLLDSGRMPKASLETAFASFNEKMQKVRACCPFVSLLLLTSLSWPTSLPFYMPSYSLPPTTPLSRCS